MRPELVHAAIKALVPGAQYAIDFDPPVIVQWGGPGPQPSQQAIDAQCASMQAAFEANEAATALRLATDATEAAAVKADGNVQTFLNFSPADLDAWVDTNIGAGGLTLAQLKSNASTAFKVLGRIALAAGRGKGLR